MLFDKSLSFSGHIFEFKNMIVFTFLEIADHKQTLNTLVSPVKSGMQQTQTMDTSS